MIRGEPCDDIVRMLALFEPQRKIGLALNVVARPKPRIERHADLRIFALKLRQLRGEPECSQAIWGRYPHAPFFALVAAERQALDRLRGSLHRHDVVANEFAGLAQANALSAAHDQAHAQPRFEIFDAPAYRRLSEAQ